MISVDEALAELRAVSPIKETKRVSLAAATGRILAQPICAKRTQPPLDMSAMDGYAVSFADIENGKTDFTVIGEAPAGGQFEGDLGSGESVRIFTGGVVPRGADHIIIQEDVTRNGDVISLTEAQTVRLHIRRAGQDFNTGDTLLPAGHKITAADLALIANGNYGEVEVRRAPRIAFIASGDELVPPGQDISDTQIPNANAAALTAMAYDWGGEIVGNILVKDDKAAFTKAVKDLPAADILVPIGGASVGDYDYAKAVFYALGYPPVFEKIAVKPGKPCWFATGEKAVVLGLPGNPSSAMVTAALFLRPLIETMTGEAVQPRHMTAIMMHELAANGERETYLRGTWHIDEDGSVRVQTSKRQDSGLTGVFAAASCLVKRAADAPACAAGDTVTFLPL